MGIGAVISIWSLTALRIHRPGPKSVARHIELSWSLQELIADWQRSTVGAFHRHKPKAGGGCYVVLGMPLA